MEWKLRWANEWERIEEDNFNWRIYAWNIGQMSDGLWELHSSYTQLPWEQQKKTEFLIMFCLSENMCWNTRKNHGNDDGGGDNSSGSKFNCTIQQHHTCSQSMIANRNSRVLKYPREYKNRHGIVVAGTHSVCSVLECESLACNETQTHTRSNKSKPMQNEIYCVRRAATTSWLHHGYKCVCMDVRRTERETKRDTEWECETKKLLCTKHQQQQQQATVLCIVCSPLRYTLHVVLRRQLWVSNTMQAKSEKFVIEKRWTNERMFTFAVNEWDRRNRQR